MLDWGDSWQAVTPAYLPAADLLDDLVSSTSAEAKALVSLFHHHKSRLCWEQSYRKEEDLVPEAMLDGYGFAEIIGQRGPFVSERIRAGIGIWGPDIEYPRHQHKAEEVYVVLAGGAEFTIGAKPPGWCGKGEVVHVESNTAHGFRTLEQSLIVYYLWQDGDLRQQSRFG